MSEWGTHPISSEFWTVGSQSTNKYCREEIHCTTLLHHCITPHQHCIKSPTRCTTLPMMHSPTSYWGQAKVTTTLLFTGWWWSSQIPCPSHGFLRSVAQGFWSQGHNRIHTVQEGSHTRTTNHCKNYLVTEWTHWHWRQRQLMTPQVTQSSDSDQHHIMTSTSKGPGSRGQVNATRKEKADTM